MTAMHTGMMPPAATPPITRLMKRTARLCAEADQDNDGRLYDAGFAERITGWAEERLAQAKR